jgi:flagellar export protein FliJ
MKAFKFKLESVIQLRESKQAEAQQDHAAAGRILEAALTELAESRAGHNALVQQLEEMQRATFRPAERDILWSALKYQKDHCNRLQHKADLAVKDREVKREKLLAAQSEHEAMLKLREKDELEYNRVAAQAERAMVDDLVNSRHAARQRPG